MSPIPTEMLYGTIILLSAIKIPTVDTGVLDITTIYRFNEVDYTSLPEDSPCVKMGSLEIHARTNALGVSLHVPGVKATRGDPAYGSGLSVSPECGSCGWKMDTWVEKSQDYVISETTLVAIEEESDTCKFDVVQVDVAHTDVSPGAQGWLDSPRGETSRTWTIRSMKNQKIKLVFVEPDSQSAELQSYEAADYDVQLSYSERQAILGRYEHANLSADYVLSQDNYLRVRVEKNIQKSFSAVYFFESRDQLALYGASGSLTSPETPPWADRLCLALLARTTRARGTVLDVVAQFVGGRDLHLGRWRDVQENTWSYVRFTADIDPEYTDKPMRIHIIATQDDGASMYIRKIEECDAEEKQSTIVVKKTVSMPAVFSGKSEDIKAFAQELSGKCINGGILSKKNGQCVCPPGFAGSYCAEGCGANKFGDDCGGKCSSFTRGCQGLALCKQEVGCDCAPGFRGRFCSDGCAEGQYGFGCRQSCGRCEDGAPCDSFTGVCPAGCEAGFFGELCRFKYKYLSTAPVVYTHGPHDLEVVFKKDLTLGRGLPRFYKIQYRLSGEKQWTSRQTRRLQENEDIVTANITGLTTWKYYDVRAVLVDLDLNSYEGEDVPYITVRTSCVVPEEVEYYIHSSDVQSNSFQVTWLYEPREDWCPLQHFEVWMRDSWRWVVYARTSDTSANFTGLLAGRRHRARVRAVTVQGPARFSRTVVVATSDQVPEMVLNLHQSIAKGRTIEIKWKEPRFTAGIIKHYIVIYKCKQLVACPNEDCSHSAGQLTVRTTHAELQKLIPHAQYYVSVSAVSGSQGPAATLFPATDFTAPEIAPEPRDPPVAALSERGFTAHWRLPRNCTGLNGFLSRYYCELEVEDSRLVVYRGHTELDHASFDGLRPATRYALRVYYVTTGGWSRRYPLLLRVRTRSAEETESFSVTSRTDFPTERTTTPISQLPTELPTRSTTASSINPTDADDWNQDKSSQNSKELGQGNNENDNERDIENTDGDGNVFDSEDSNNWIQESGSESKSNDRKRGNKHGEKKDGGSYENSIRSHESEEDNERFNGSEERSRRKHGKSENSEQMNSESIENSGKEDDSMYSSQESRKQDNDNKPRSKEENIGSEYSFRDELTSISLDKDSTETTKDIEDLSDIPFFENTYEQQSTELSTSTTETSWWNL